MSWFWKRAAWYSAILGGFIAFFPIPAWTQKYTKSDRDQAQGMLREVAVDVRKRYYDPKFHGVNWDARVREAKENIDKADSLNSAITEIAAALDSLNDSHTFLTPPPRTRDFDYGFKMQMIGDHCYVLRVRPGSDAEKKGLKAGDEIVAVNEHRVSRQVFWRLEYIYKALRPQLGLRLTLKTADGPEQPLEVLARLQTSSDIKYFLQQGINQIVRDRDKEHHLERARYFEKGDEFLAVRIPEFAFSAEEVDNIISKMKKHKGVVLDLRDNPGGYMDTLDRLLGGFFQYDLKIFDRVGRDSTKSVSVTGRHHDAFTGRFVVLIDSNSASASELFARVIQLQKRGFVLGDNSAGSVMEARFYPHELHLDADVFFGASITGAELLMTDGKSLEHAGVEPDIKILPTAQDLANGFDPAMAKAALLVGVQLSPQEAGTMFPYEGPLEN